MVKNDPHFADQMSKTPIHLTVIPRIQLSVKRRILNKYLFLEGDNAMKLVNSVKTKEMSCFSPRRIKCENSENSRLTAGTSNFM